MKNDDEVKEPPCEMFKYMYAGLKTVEAGVKAIAFHLGLDPWNSSAYLLRTALTSMVEDQEQIDSALEIALKQYGPSLKAEGVMISWLTNENQIQAQADEITLQNGFYPIKENQNV